MLEPVREHIELSQSDRMAEQPQNPPEKLQPDDPALVRIVKWMLT